MKYFVTAIGTDSGKTLASAILCEAFGADYWKPIQAGLPRDSERVAQLVTNKETVIHPERFLLKTPVSPHASATIDGVPVFLNSFSVPHTKNSLIVEGAGGCLVPLNNEDLMIDLIVRLGLEAIVISNHYLGSINHTLLTLEALNKRKVSVKGIIFNGGSNAESERIILRHTNLKCLLKIDREPIVNADVVKKYASMLKANWNE